MNIGTLKNEMSQKSEEWSELFNEDGERTSVGAVVASWRRVLDKVTDKLVNPRKQTEAELQILLNEANRTVEELRTQYKSLKEEIDHATALDEEGFSSEALDAISEFTKRADEGDHKRS